MKAYEVGGKQPAEGKILIGNQVANLDVATMALLHINDCDFPAL